MSARTVDRFPRSAVRRAHRVSAAQPGGERCSSRNGLRRCSRRRRRERRARGDALSAGRVVLAAPRARGSERTHVSRRRLRNEAAGAPAERAGEQDERVRARAGPLRGVARATACPTPGRQLCPRMLYGRLPERAPARATRRSSPEHRSRRRHRNPLTRSDGRWVVHLEDDSRLASRNVVLALGNLPPADPVRFEAAPPAGYVGQTRGRGRAWASVPPDAPRLLVGTGQHDVRRRAQPCVRRDIAARCTRSRATGATPAAAGRRWPRPLWTPAPAGGSPVQCLRWLRAEIDAAAREGYDWRTRRRRQRATARPRSGTAGPSRRRARSCGTRGSLWDAHRHRVGAGGRTSRSRHCVATGRSASWRAASCRSVARRTWMRAEHLRSRCAGARGAAARRR